MKTYKRRLEELEIKVDILQKHIEQIFKTIDRFANTPDKVENRLLERTLSTEWVNIPEANDEG